MTAKHCRDKDLASSTKLTLASASHKVAGRLGPAAVKAADLTKRRSHNSAGFQALKPIRRVNRPVSRRWQPSAFSAVFMTSSRGEGNIEKIKH